MPTSPLTSSMKNRIRKVCLNFIDFLGFNDLRKNISAYLKLRAVQDKKAMHGVNIRLLYG